MKSYEWLPIEIISLLLLWAVCVCKATNIQSLLGPLSRCPAEQRTIQWDQRAEELCGSEPSNPRKYHCLQDESSSSNSVYEFCSEPVDIDEGHYPTYNPHVKRILPKDCPTDYYQERKVSSYLINNCTKKSLCDDSGQMMCDDGPATQDRTCMCNYMDGYARSDYYGTNPNNTEICCPIGIPCKCFMVEPPCSSTPGYELNAASQCVEKCPVGYNRPPRSLECVKYTVTQPNVTPAVSNPFDTTTNETNSNVIVIYKDADKKNESPPDDKSLYFIAIAVVGAVILVLLILLIICVIRRKHHCSRKKDLRNGIEQKEPHQVIYINNPGHVQFGDNNTAISQTRKESDHDDDQSGESSGSDFKGFPRNQNYQKLKEVDSLPRGATSIYHETDSVGKSDGRKYNFKEMYQNTLMSLTEAARAKGFIVRDVPGDGNCMYNSVLIQLESHHPKLTVDDMRKHVQKFIESNPSTPSDMPYKSLLSALHWKPGAKSKQQQEYKKLLRNKSVEESQRDELLFQIYLNEVRENEWGDPFTLHALSQIYNVEIKVLSSRNLNQFTITSVVDNPKMTIYLGHLAVNGEDLHYVSLLPPVDSEDLENPNLDYDINKDINKDSESIKKDTNKDTENVNNDTYKGTENVNNDTTKDTGKSQEDEIEDNITEEMEVKEPLLST